MPITNKYAGDCATCGERVQAGKGYAILTGEGWRVQCPVQCQPRARPAPVVSKVGDLAGIMALFDKARQHLKHPTIVLGVPAVGPDFAVRVSVGTDKAAVPGSLTVLGEAKDLRSGRRPWFGRVRVDGRFELSRELRTDEQIARAVQARLSEFAADPARVAGDHGRLTGKCCFCRLPLSDERSTAVGYGKKCAENFGLPWGARPAEFAGSANEVVALDRGDRFGWSDPAEVTAVRSAAKPTGLDGGEPNDETLFLRHAARVAGRALETAYPFGYRSGDDQS